MTIAQLFFWKALAISPVRSRVRLVTRIQPDLGHLQKAEIYDRFRQIDPGQSMAAMITRTDARKSSQIMFATIQNMNASPISVGDGRRRGSA